MSYRAWGNMRTINVCIFLGEKIHSEKATDWMSPPIGHSGKGKAMETVKIVDGQQGVGGERWISRAEIFKAVKYSLWSYDDKCVSANICSHPQNGQHQEGTWKYMRDSGCLWWVRVGSSLGNTYMALWWVRMMGGELGTCEERGCMEERSRFYWELKIALKSYLYIFKKFFGVIEILYLLNISLFFYHFLFSV